MALENKLGITESAQLAREEERISKKKAAELFENGILATLKPGSFSALKATRPIRRTGLVVPSGI